MFKLIERLGEKRDAIKQEKSHLSPLINQWYIYLNTIFVMAISLGVFFIIGYLFDLQYSIRYLLYSIEASIVFTMIIILIYQELPYRKLSTISYHPLIPHINKVIKWIGVLSGVLLINSIVFMPQFTTYLDWILHSILFTSTVVYFYLYSGTSYHREADNAWGITLDIFLYTMILTSAFIVINIQEPWLWSIAGIILWGICAIIRNEVVPKIPLFDSTKWDEYRGYSTILVVLLSLSLVLTKSEYFIGDKKQIFIEKPLIQEQVLLENQPDITNAIKVDEKWFITTKDDAHAVSVYSLDGTFISSISFTNNVFLYELKNEPYVYLKYYDDQGYKCELYKIEGEEKVFIGQIQLDENFSRSEPIIINDEYYALEIVSYSYVEMLYSLTNSGDTITVNDLLLGEAYIDESYLLYQLGDERYYLIGDGMYYRYSADLYSRGYVYTVDMAMFKMGLQTVEDFLNQTGDFIFYFDLGYVTNLHIGGEYIAISSDIFERITTYDFSGDEIGHLIGKGSAFMRPIYDGDVIYFTVGDIIYSHDLFNPTRYVFATSIKAPETYNSFFAKHLPIFTNKDSTVLEYDDTNSNMETYQSYASTVYSMTKDYVRAYVIFLMIGFVLITKKQRS